MWPDVQPSAGRKIHRTEIIEKNKWANAAPRHLRQEAGDKKTVTQVMGFSADRDHGPSLAVLVQKL
jgi:hypothetical protein